MLRGTARRRLSLEKLQPRIVLDAALPALLLDGPTPPTEEVREAVVDPSGWEDLNGGDGDVFAWGDGQWTDAQWDGEEPVEMVGGIDFIGAVQVEAARAGESGLLAAPAEAAASFIDSAFLAVFAPFAAAPRAAEQLAAPPSEQQESVEGDSPADEVLVAAIPAVAGDGLIEESATGSDEEVDAKSEPTDDDELSAKDEESSSAQAQAEVTRNDQ